jgi:hypothetical protein
MVGMPTGMPLSSWRDLSDELTAAQMAELAELEARGANPGMLLVKARKMAAHNLDAWL